MLQTVRLLTIGAAVAAALATSLLPASAAEHHSRGKAARVKLVPAHQRPDFIGAPGYVGGPAGPRVPTLIEFGDTAPVFGTALLGSGAPGSNGLLGGGGLLGVGVLPSTGIFGNLPVLGGLGL